MCRPCLRGVAAVEEECLTSPAVFVSPFRQNELIKGSEYVSLVRHTMKFTIVFRKTTNTLVPGLAFYNVPKFVFGYTVLLTFPRRNNYALHSPLTLILSSGSSL